MVLITNETSSSITCIILDVNFYQKRPLFQLWLKQINSIALQSYVNTTKLLYILQHTSFRIKSVLESYIVVKHARTNVRSEEFGLSYQ